mmetsp:Transcript_30608/g.40439  ORF Transcript_30608/g.40439 Transcript_30608/m.40439 type:complete len:219 (-) Transcript_30608:1133-1789(-)
MPLESLAVSGSCCCCSLHVETCFFLLLARVPISATSWEDFSASCSSLTVSFSSFEVETCRVLLPDGRVPSLDISLESWAASGSCSISCLFSLDGGTCLALLLVARVATSVTSWEAFSASRPCSTACVSSFEEVFLVLLPDGRVISLDLSTKSLAASRSCSISFLSSSAAETCRVLLLVARVPVAVTSWRAFSGSGPSSDVCFVSCEVEVCLVLLLPDG